MKKLYLINHSHTDIGYTAVQELIMQCHVDYIIQAIDIVSAELAEKGHCDFVWTCENYWQVKNFRENATPEQIELFERYVEAGYIDFSSNYLNLNELVDPDILSDCLAAAHQYGQRFSRPIDSAMTADINGFSWGYAHALAKNGIDNLFTCIHAHHGMYPLFKSQIPFWWEAPTREKVLVWNGEHYQIGNETYLMPNAQMSYQIEDEYAGDLSTPQLEVAKKRIFGYFEELAQSDYPYDFVPMMISGFMSDNAGPDRDIVESIAEWNAEYGDEITVEMIGLNQFFEVLRQTDLSQIPTYRGDWNDWWAEGVGSTPAATKIYKGAVRNYRLLQDLTDEKTVKGPLAQAARDDLMLFAEHTWGYSSSASEPWNTLVNELEYRKFSYAANASTEIDRALIAYLMKHDDYAMPKANRPQFYRVINPYDRTVTQNVTLLMEAWEHFGKRRIMPNLMPYVEAYDRETNEVLPCQVMITARAYEIELVVTLAPKQVKQIGLRLRETPNLPPRYRPALKGAENVKDIVYPGLIDDSTVETKYFTVKLNNDVGLAQIIYRPTGEDIIDHQAAHPLFQGIYEKTTIQTDPCMERRRMGRNRKGKEAQRWNSQITDIRILERGPVFTEVAIDCQLAGTQIFSYVLRIYQDLAKITCMLRIQKDSVWDPENLYFALPLKLAGERYFKKSGSLMRPGIDQLPGTNTEFYLLDTGILYRDQAGTGLAISLKDAPLVTLGDLAHHPIHLCDEQSRAKNQADLYSWVMNNFWETNFKVDLSGFYEFAYSLTMASAVPDMATWDQHLKEEDQGLIAIQVDF